MVRMAGVLLEASFCVSLLGARTWCGIRESNSYLLLGKQTYYRYTNPAGAISGIRTPDPRFTKAVL
jgi:hypothetical protein